MTFLIDAKEAQKAIAKWIEEEGMTFDEAIALLIEKYGKKEENNEQAA